MPCPKSERDWRFYVPTKKKVRSLKSNARAHASTNSRDAPLRKSAGRKSGSENEKTLRVATPANIGWLSQSGLIVPDNLDPDEEVLHLDFTRLSNREVGAVHSRFAVRHAHVLFVRAGIASERLRLQRRHRLALGAFRIRRGDEFRTDRACTEAFSRAKDGKRLEKAMMELEIKATMLDAVIGGYDDIVKAASREMSRRDSERAPRD